MLPSTETNTTARVPGSVVLVDGGAVVEGVAVVGVVVGFDPLEQPASTEARARAAANARRVRG